MNLSDMFFLPELASAHGHKIDFIIYLIHGLMAFLFIGWGIYFITVLFLFRKGRNPKASYHVLHNPASTAVEIFVIVFEAVLLVGFAIPFWNAHVNRLPEGKNIVEVRVIGEQFAWNVHYPGEDKKFGNASPEYFDKQTNPLGLDPNDPYSKDDIVTINQLHLPIGRPALIHVGSKDVIHSFSLPVMRVKQDAIPGMRVPVSFTPTKTGKFEIACAQLCGLGHYYMRGYLTIEYEEEFDAWLEKQAAAQATSEDEAVDDFWL